MPFFDSKTTITVSPFYGENDICPKVKSTNFLHVDFTKLNLRLCSENIYLISRALFPPDVKVRGAMGSGGTSLGCRGPTSCPLQTSGCKQTPSLARLLS